MDVKVEAIQLIESNIDLSLGLSQLMAEEGLLSEAESWKATLQLANKLDISAALLATQTLVGKILKREKDGVSVVEMTNELESRGLLEHHLFVSSLVKSISKVPLKVVCRLLISSHLSFDHLTSEFGEMSFLLEAFTSKDVPPSLLQDVVRCLVCEVYPPHPTPVSSAQLTAKTIADFIKQQYSLTFWLESSYTMLDALSHCTSIPNQTIKQLYFDLLADFLSPSSPTLSYNDVIFCQDKWKSSTLPKATASLFSKLLQKLDHQEVKECMDRTLAYSADQVNWDGLLSMVVCYVTSSEQAARRFKDYVVHLVAQATSLSAGELFKACLILARQAALEGPHVHPSYQRWFVDQFDGQHSSKRLLHFVIKQLTSLVPFEPAYCLEAHVRLPRFSAAQTAVGEYISLAQVRLNELKVTAGSSKSQNADSSALNHVHVQEMIEAHSKSGHIPPQVLQASLFQKPYYVREFLPTLLSLTLPGSLDPSPLIQALARENKIPKKMLESYHSKMSSSGQKSTSMLTPPTFERVDVLFQSLLDVAQSAEFDSKGMRLLSKISTALSNLSLASSGRGLNWTSPDIPLDMIQLADLVVNNLCRVVLVEEEQHKASHQTLTVLTSHDALHKPILVRLWELIHSQMSDFTDAQFTGIAGLCHRLWLSRDPLPSLYPSSSLYRHGSLSSLNSFSECCEALLGQLPHTTDAQMYATVKFASKFISCSLRDDNAGERLGPTVLLTKLKYLCNRSELLKSECPLVLDKLSQHNQWTTVHVCFVEWLKWELEIETDILLDWERERYLCQELYDYYLNREEDGVSFTMEDALCHLYTILSHNHAKPGYSNLIPLLEEVCNSLPPVNGQPSLLKALTKAVKEKVEVDQTCAFRRCLNHQRLLSHIPAHLFFSNGPDPDRELHSDALLSASQCLKLLMEAGDVGVVMDTPFTHYICKGLLALERTANDQTLCQQFLHTSPIFFASLTCSWPKVKHLFTSRKPTHISNLSDWINCCSCTIGEIPSPPLPGTPHHVLASCLIKRYLSTSIPNLRAVLQTLPVEVVYIIVDFAVRMMTISDSAQNSLVDLIKTCTTHCPPSLSVCCSDIQYIANHSLIIKASREEFPFQCGSSLQQLPVVYFKLLQDNINTFLSSSIAALLLPVALLSHSGCLDLASSLHSYQALESGFLELCTNVTKRFIKAASNSSLQTYAHLSHSTLKPYINSHTSSTT